MNTGTEKIKVLIIDDSALMRKFLSDVFAQSGNVEVVGTALDASLASNKIDKLAPDVITLDIEMPKMNGLVFLEKVMKENPLPVIMVSSLTSHGAKESIKALELGAIDVVAKPNMGDPETLKSFSQNLVQKVIIAAKSKHAFRKHVSQSRVLNKRPNTKYSADVILAKRERVSQNLHSEKVVAIGASTGGTQVIDAILSSLPATSPGIVITQHMPEKFTEAFANRLNEKSDLWVREAKDGDRVLTGMAFIAPGGRHMLLKSDSKGYYVEINDGPPVNRHRPSVDVLFRSVSQYAGKRALGVICTGMGDDGAKGLLEMKDSGAETVAQDQESCVVFGMPKEAIKLDAAATITDVEGIISILSKVKG